MDPLDVQGIIHALDRISTALEKLVFEIKLLPRQIVRERASFDLPKKTRQKKSGKSD